MEFFVSTSRGPAKQRTDCAIVGVYDKGTLSSAAEELDTAHRRTHRAAGEARRPARQDGRPRAARRLHRRAGANESSSSAWAHAALQAQAVSQGAVQRARCRGPHWREGRGQLSRPGRSRRRGYVRTGAHRGRGRGEFAVSNSRPQDRQQATEADAGAVRHRRGRARRSRQRGARHRARPGHRRRHER